MSCKKTIKVIDLGAQTINLARQQVKSKAPICPGQKWDACSGSIPSPPGKRINVCTAEQLRGMCPPDPCECPPPKPPPPTTAQRIRRLMLTGVKLVFLAGVIKWTDDLGIWRDARHTDRLLDNAKARLQPIVQSVRPTKDEDYSHTNFATKWNNLVFYVFNFMAVLPATVSGAVMRKLHSIQGPPADAEPQPEPENKKENKENKKENKENKKENKENKKENKENKK